MNLRLLMVVGLIAVMAVAWWASFILYRATQASERIAPLEPREWESLTVVVVGSGSDYENPDRLGPSTGIAWNGRILLVDAGRGLCEALRKAQIPVTQPRQVLLTNLLPHNTVGLDDLLQCSALRDAEAPLRVVGPRGTTALVEGLRAAHAAGASALGRALPLGAGSFAVVAEEVEDGFSEEQDGVILRAGALGGGPIDALAWRFERGRRSVVVSGTGWAPDALIDFARDTDLLVHEGVFIPKTEDLEAAGVTADPERLAAEAAVHTDLLAVGDLATRAGVKGLALVRLRPPPFFEFQMRAIIAETYDGPIYLPSDGDELTP